MMTIMSNISEKEIILLAIIADLFIGDPKWLYHPVQIIGYFVKKLELVFSKLMSKHLKLAGILLNIIIVGGTFFLFYYTSQILFSINYNLGILFEIIIIYFSLAIHSLTKEGWMIRRYLNHNQIDEARKQTQKIVSRDLTGESQKGIIRAALESLTENLSDGIIAPLFYAMLGGAPLAMTYKAINTLDSMVGYKNSKYEQLGWFSARLDDVANYVPARITGILIFLSSIILIKHPIKSLRSWLRDSQKGPSLNGGIPIVTFAGAMDITLGGDCYNKEKGGVIKIPEVGGKRKKLNISDILWVNIFIYISSVLMVVFYLATFTASSN